MNYCKNCGQEINEKAKALQQLMQTFINCPDEFKDDVILYTEFLAAKRRKKGAR